MQISKAVITAAGRGARQYPASDTVQKVMLPLVDRDGVTKPVLQIIAEEAFESGIEAICVVSAPAMKTSIAATFATTPPICVRRTRGSIGPRNRRAVSSISKSGFNLPSSPSPRAMVTPSGAHGRLWEVHRFYCFWATISISPLSQGGVHRQLIDLASAENCAVSAVQATREHLIHQYGTLTGRRQPQHPDIYAIDEIIEKPNPTLAELRLHVPGLRAGHYLCFFGMHVLTPVVFELLDQLVRENVRELGQIQLTTALNSLARKERYLALETRGSRFNLGVKFGVVEAQIALAMGGVDREEMLALLLESMVRIERNTAR